MKSIETSLSQRIKKRMKKYENKFKIELKGYNRAKGYLEQMVND